ncbi:hypothetical protein [Sphingomonas prati]|uniref:Aryl-alcohol dehydrogenase-like predicted oxidoreductase n=1 Tax=Sphingomonas prati TaxID=1843237 RepID=A0A7W9BVB8_9SPHN|nr:hypothetical protein [Sphingomonas prati]MBB5730813.1 aryl-alcohol dehydrogenase-like predicted oxidoreductase [Sphingomonas prati]GGE96927.1 hypothetical protein GCM10011404_32610 [Sphingomonas prati]
MKRREIGDSGIQASKIGLGSWPTYAGGLERKLTLAMFAAHGLGATARQRRVA